MQDKILIAEDNEITASILESILKKNGYDVLLAKNGKEALEIVSQTLPDLILLDILMPELNGLQTAEKLKDEDRTKDIPIIFLSSLTDDKNIKRGFSLGGVDYIRKPFRMEELLVRVDTHLRLSSLTKELENFFNINLDLLCIADLNGNILNINRVAEEFFGLIPDQMEERNILEFIHTEDIDLTKKYLEELQKTKNKKKFTIRIKHPGNSSRYLEWQCVKHDQFLYLSARDVTAHLKYETKLKNKKSEMERLLYKVSHDLRVPLINIRGFTKNLEENCINFRKLLVDKMSKNDGKKESFESEFCPEITESFQFIYKYIEKMDDLLYQFDFLSHGPSSFVNKENVDVNYIVSEILNKYKEKAQLKHVRIITEKLEDCYADEYLLYKAFTYVIDNALEFSDPKKKAIINISSEINGDQVVYSIEDNGVGIDKKNIEKVFEIFYKVDETQGGRGLGLPTTEKILQKISGKIWIESKKDFYTTVYFSLPVKKK